LRNVSFQLPPTKLASNKPSTTSSTFILASVQSQHVDDNNDTGPTIKLFIPLLI
jgi:hypothetical protein